MEMEVDRGTATRRGSRDVETRWRRRRNRHTRWLAVEGGTAPTEGISLTRLIFAFMVAGGLQYGWTLLTPYVQCKNCLGDKQLQSVHLHGCDNNHKCVVVEEFHGSIQQVITARHQSCSSSLFAFLGLPLAVSISLQILYSVPFAVTQQLTVNEGGGRGDCCPRCRSMGCLGRATFLLWLLQLPACAVLLDFFMLPKLSKINFKAYGCGFH